MELFHYILIGLFWIIVCIGLGPRLFFWDYIRLDVVRSNFKIDTLRQSLFAYKQAR